MPHKVSRITKPESAIAVDMAEGRRLIDAIWFFQWLIDNDCRFNADGVGIRSAVRIERALADARSPAVKVIDLLPDDRARLHASAECPTLRRTDGSTFNAYPSTNGRVYLPFVDALATPIDLEVDA